MTEEIIELINSIDTANFVTYYYGCIFLIAILSTIYLVIWAIVTTIIRKKQNNWLDNQSQEIQNAIRKYKSINIFTNKETKK